MLTISAWSISTIFVSFTTSLLLTGVDPGNENVFKDRFFQEVVSTSSGWSCAAGVDCQDVFEIQLEAGATVTVSVTGVTGSSDARISALRPGAGFDSDNALVGTNKDLSCAGMEGTEEASFIVDTTGTWQIAVGRDWGQSAGSTGTYLVSVTSALPISGGLQLIADDVPSQAADMRCGSEYVLDGSWSCGVGDSCQDTFTVDLAAGTPLQLGVDNLTGGSVPRLALHEPGEILGGVNLLTNTLEDRECVGQDEADLPPAYPVSANGAHTVAISRDWGSSMGSSGTYELTISADGAFFQPPVQRFDDAISQAAGSRCGWIYSVAATWSCQVGDSCQDVYDIPLQSGSSLTLQATEVTGNSVARLAAYAPGSPLSGTNLLTGGSLDYSCNGQDTNELAPPVSISSSGIHRIAFARDWGSSSGSSGSYRGSIIVTDGYGGNVIQSAQDTESSSSGFTCPP